jgi:ribosomal protein S18 acetylase RimI-like enzyme
VPKPILSIHLAWTLRDFMAVRKIRNECRTFMTRDQNYISVAKQVGFWLRHRRPTATYRVYLGTVEGRPAAYGIVQGHLVSGGLLRRYRGYGHGRTLFTRLTHQAAEPALLEVLASNVHAQSLYASLGYVQYVQAGSVLKMRHTGRVVHPSKRKAKAPPQGKPR